MPAPNLDFEFYAGGIEDAIIATLQPVMEPMGVRDFGTYSGELDSEKLKEALADLSPRFPLILVGYADGVDVMDPVTSPVMNRSLEYRHDCSFAVICATDDARGETARRRGKLVGNRKLGAYQMLAKVRELLGGLRFSITVDGTAYLLNTQILEPKGVENIARLANITAFAAIFETAFKWKTPDRTQEPIDVTELIVGVSSLNDAGKRRVTPELPGVSTEVLS